MAPLMSKIEQVQALTPAEERAVSLYRYLAQRILGTSIQIVLVRREPQNDTVVDATFTRQRRLLSINLLGHWDLNDPLGETSLALLFHELAHYYTAEHDHTFSEALSRVAGRGAALLAREGQRLAELYGVEARSM